jgi:hypothetical protein
LKDWGAHAPIARAGNYELIESSMLTSIDRVLTLLWWKKERMREMVGFVAQRMMDLEVEAPGARLASLGNVFFRADDLVDADGSRIAMMAEIQALHSRVRRWIERADHASPVTPARPI